MNLHSQSQDTQPSPPAVACEAPQPLPDHYIPLFPHHPTWWSHFQKNLEPHFSFSHFSVAIFALHMNAPTSPQPHHIPHKAGREDSGQLIFPTLLLNPCTWFLNLECTTAPHPPCVPHSSLSPWSRCQGWLRYCRRQLSRAEALEDNQLVGSNCLSRQVPLGRWNQALPLFWSSL